MSFSLGPRLRALLLLWGAQFFFSAIASGPLLLALGETTDSDLSTPGGLMLLEALRLQKRELLFAARETLVLLAVGLAILLFFRAQLSLAIVQATSEAKTRSLTTRTSLGYGGIWVVGTLLRCLLVLGGVWMIYPILGAWEGGLQAQLLVRPVLYAVTTVLCLVGVSVVTETAQLALFLDKSTDASKSRSGRFRQVLAQRFPSLLALRLARGIVHAALLALSVRFFILPQGMAASSPLLCAGLNQITVGATLCIEALWLHFVATLFHPNKVTGRVLR